MTATCPHNLAIYPRKWGQVGSNERRWGRETALGEYGAQWWVDWRCDGRIMRLGKLSTEDVDNVAIVWMSRALTMFVWR